MSKNSKELHLFKQFLEERNCKVAMLLVCKLQKHNSVLLYTIKTKPAEQVLSMNISNELEVSKMWR